MSVVVAISGSRRSRISWGRTDPQRCRGDVGNKIDGTEQNGVWIAGLHTHAITNAARRMDQEKGGLQARTLTESSHDGNRISVISPFCIPVCRLCNAWIFLDRRRMSRPHDMLLKPPRMKVTPCTSGLDIGIDLGHSAPEVAKVGADSTVRRNIKT